MAIVDKSVIVSENYVTHGNGARSLVRLKDNSLVSVVIDNWNKAYKFYSSTNGGLTWFLVRSYTVSSPASGIAIQTNGELVFAIVFSGGTTVNSFSFDPKSPSTLLHNSTIELGTLTDTKDMSLIINDDGTKLYGAWVCKIPSNTNTYNIRYAEGTISSNGNVTWNTVEQVTSYSSSNVTYFAEDVTIILVNNIPTIFIHQRLALFKDNTIATTGNGLTMLKRNTELQYKGASLDSRWSAKSIINSPYFNAYPSAIFIPKSINGLENGQVWLSWNGSDAISNGATNLNVAYSNDGGLTFNITKLTFSTNTDIFSRYPSITANKNGKVQILFDTIENKIAMTGLATFENNSWTLSTLGNNTGKDVSALVDLSISTTLPLHIRNENYGISFSGSWSYSSISVPSKDIGIITNKEILKYKVETDTTTTTITEKINGVTVATKTATNGQDLSVSLTDEQWDAINFGDTSIYQVKNNILPPFSAWTKDVGVTAQSDYTLYTDDVYSYPTAITTINVEPYTEYELSFNLYTLNTYGWLRIYDTDSGMSHNWIINSYVLSGDRKFVFTTRSDKIRISLSGYTNLNSSDTTIFSNVKLTKKYVKNKLSISTDNDTWEYPFRKALPNDADMLTIAKANKDIMNVVIEPTKSKLATYIASKINNGINHNSFNLGGTDGLVDRIIKLPPDKKIATGTASSTNSALTFEYLSSTANTSMYYVAITGLSFKPSTVVICGINNAVTVYRNNGNNYKNIVTVSPDVTNSSSNFTFAFKADTRDASVSYSGFTLPFSVLNSPVTWTAYE